MNIRRLKDNISSRLMLLIVVLIFNILARMVPALNIDMLTKTAQGGYYLGKGGGILNAIIGSAYLASSSSF